MHLIIDALMSNRFRMMRIPNSAQMVKGLIASKSRLQRVSYQNAAHSPSVRRLTHLQRLLSCVPTEGSFERDVVGDLMLKAEAVDDGERHAGVYRLLTL